MGLLADMDKEVWRLTRSVIARQIERDESAIQGLIDDTMASGAMRQDFGVVLVWRVGAGPGYQRWMEPQLR